MHYTLGSPPLLCRGKTSLSLPHYHLIRLPSCFSLPCPLHRPPAFSLFLSLSSFFFPPSRFRSSFQTSESLNLQANARSWNTDVVPSSFQEEPVRSLCLLLMKNSPLNDLLGVRNHRSIGTWFLGAFKKLPGGNHVTVLTCTRFSASITLLLLFFFHPEPLTSVAKLK